jgi:5-methyltetrahydrofolate--homocysteine methyltransferase
MMGVSPVKALETLGALDVIAIGANCGTGSDELEVAVKAMREASPEAILVAKANAGIPQVVKGGGIVYTGTPEAMAQYASNVRDLGVSLIGGCCGTTPVHIRAMAEALGSLIPR